MEAIRWLAKRYQIELEETAMSDEAKLVIKEEESLRIVNDFAASYFSKTLLESDEGRNIGLSYFEERGFRKETIEKFQLGYSLEKRDSFLTAALEKSYQKNILLSAGLINEKEHGAFDNYSGRVIFPIHNQSGRVIGFGARILKTSTKAPKYINSPENALYQKSKSLYGIFFSRNAIIKNDECLLVEGYTDVISLHQAGIENVVSSSGTSLTEGQLLLVKRFTKNLTILYDGDSAGVKAALRGLDMAIEVGMNVKLVLLPNNHDPDSFVQEIGASAFTDYISANKKDVILFKLEASLQEAQHDSQAKAVLINEIAETISKINKIDDFAKQEDYIKRCSNLLQIDEQGLINLVNKKIREKISKREKSDSIALRLESEVESNEKIQEVDETLRLVQKDYLQEKNLIKILLQYGAQDFDNKNTVAEYIRTKISENDFVNEEWKQIFDIYFKEMDENLQFPKPELFTYHESDKIRNAAINALYFAYELSKKWNDEKRNISTPIKGENYLHDTHVTLIYFILRKSKATIISLQEELKTLNDWMENVIIMNALKELKENEKNLLDEMKTVMFH